MLEFITEINKALESGLEGFKKKILHQEKNNSLPPALVIDLTEYIDFILDNTRDKNIGEPLHQAIASGKIQLAIHLLEHNKTKNIFAR
ncbi:hypothetical protein [Legionella sp.]|uniref:hypothetical protein n=1 Tax=Legionella sp. TaxID=459 RepID=UPI003CA20F07